MRNDLKVLMDSILNGKSDKSYDIWSVKLTLISQNYSNFNIFISEYIHEESISLLVNSISESFKLLSMYCLKLFHRRSGALIEQFTFQVKKILQDDEQLKSKLMGVITRK